MKLVSVFLTLAVLVTSPAAAQSTPPEMINYQGVLRDASDAPLDGTYTMVFRFYSEDTDGDEVLVDTHAAVTVSDGLFNVPLGSGTVTDGSGPGEYTSLSRVHADYPDLHLEVEVGGETMSPRIRVASAGYALNTRYVRGTEMVSDASLDLYVNGTTGDDLNDGLSPDSAKRTIQAAVDAAPILLTGPVTIHIADGTYHGSVLIDRRILRRVAAFPGIILVGNETSPQNVVLDGQSTFEDGIIVLGFAAIIGIEVTNYLEEGLEVDFGYMIVDHCRVIGNNVGGDPWGGGIGVFTATANITNTVIANNSSHGLEIGEGWFSVEIGNVEITGNTYDGIHLDAPGKLFSGDDSVLIQSNGGVGVFATDGAAADFSSRADLTIQSNTGGSMQASYHSTIRGYGNGTTGSCAADPTSVCEP